MMRCYLLIFIIVLSGCSSRTDLAPVVELKWRPQNAHPLMYRVQRGDTLYAVAFRYDQDVRALAAYNRLRSPYALRVGQVIKLGRLQPAKASGWNNTSATKKMIPVRQKRAVSARHTTLIRKLWPQNSKQGGAWLWPAQGRIAGNYLPQEGKKGIDIAGRKGEKVKASAKGVVAYAGNGLAGYGNLIIIKHDGQYLTAYGNNFQNRVVEGQQVKAGQVIADMGMIDRKFWGVHFEIRRSGQPVNPMNYLRKG